MLLKRFEWPEAFAFLIHSSLVFPWNESSPVEWVRRKSWQCIKITEKFDHKISFSAFETKFVHSKLHRGSRLGVHHEQFMAGAFCIIIVWHALMLPSLQQLLRQKHLDVLLISVECSSAVEITASCAYSSYLLFRADCEFKSSAALFGWSVQQTTDHKQVTCSACFPYSRPPHFIPCKSKGIDFLCTMHIICHLKVPSEKLKSFRDAKTIAVKHNEKSLSSQISLSTAAKTKTEWYTIGRGKASSNSSFAFSFVCIALHAECSARGSLRKTATER